jgi:hypothetical protein
MDLPGYQGRDLIRLMKRLFSFLIAAAGLGLLAIAPVAQAEDRVGREILDALRVVVDPEGQANVRSGASLQSKITGQLPAGSVVAIDPGPAKDWTRLWLAMEGDKPRYVHSSRLQPVAGWKQVAGREQPDKSAAGVKADGLEVTIKALPFVAARHKITKDAQGMELVDGQSPWGMDGGLPGQSLSLTVSLNGQPVVLPKAATANLFQPNLETLVLLTPARASDQALVIMTNGDGGGGYCVVWAFRNGIYVGREVFVPF